MDYDGIVYIVYKVLLDAIQDIVAIKSTLFFKRLKMSGWMNFTYKICQCFPCKLK